jgi:hypothetical protein
MLPPAVDYTDKDYASLRRAMLDLARFRLPEWTDHSESDLGVLLVELFAYMGDIVLYYQDRIASEAFLHTAAERRSVLQQLRLIGYELRPPSPAAASLALTFQVPAPGQPGIVTVPRRAQFASRANGTPPQVFEYLGPDLAIDLRSAQVVPAAGNRVTYPDLPVVHSESVSQETIGSSTGEPSQTFRLSQTPVIRESVAVEVDAGAGFVPWTRRDDLLYFTDAEGRVTLSGPESREFMVRFDDQDTAWIVFGDGVYGALVPRGVNNIRASYRVGGGAAGNVAAGAIAQAKTAIPGLSSVTNPGPAAGGADGESIEHAVRFGPLAFRSAHRAVTLSDFVSLAHQAGGVAKVRARSRGWNLVELFVAPEGERVAPTPEDLKRRLVRFFDDKRMVGTFVEIRDATPVSLDIAVDVVVEHNFNPELVRQDVRRTVEGLLSFREVDFGRPVYISKVYEAVEALAGVHAANVTRFRRADRAARLTREVSEIPGDLVRRLPEPLLRALRAELEADGRVEIAEHEIPVLGTLEVRTEVEVR